MSFALRPYRDASMTLGVGSSRWGWLDFLS
jgi:hypothetical protein